MTTSTSTTTSISTADRDFLDGTKGFIDRYVRNCAFFPIRKEAYEHTEAQYIALMGHAKYSSYESFRANLSKYYSKHG